MRRSSSASEAEEEKDIADLADAAREEAAREELQEQIESFLSAQRVVSISVIVVRHE